MQKILIVEDDIDIQDILKNHLIDAGYEVAVASDFLADYLKQVIPDLRIFYLQMSRAAVSPLMRARSNYLAKILLNECTSRLGFSYSSSSHKYTYKGNHDNRFGFEHRDYDLAEIENLLLK